MRKLLIIVSLASMACANEAAKVDTAASSDSTIVAGPPAVPASLPSADTTQAPTTKSPGTKAPSADRPPASTTGNPSRVEARSDSVRGIVSVVGTSFDKHVMVAERGTRRRVEIVGTLSSLIGHVAGAEVSALGSLSGTQLDATSFLVRSVNGEPAIDGTLTTEGGSLFIVTVNGTRTRIAAPPPPLVGHDGARVWITGDPSKGVSSFGFIDPPR